MTDELKTAPEGGQQEVQYTEAEQRAMESGWVPKDEWQGDPEAWRPAKEYLDRGELFQKIETQNRTIKEVKKALDDLRAHHKSVRETEYARAIAELKAAKLEALQDNDAATVMKIDDQIDLVKGEQDKLKSQPTQTVEAEVNPVFQNWVEANKWYEKDQPMRAYADALGRELAYRGMSPEQVLKEVEKQVRTEFPNKFRNPNRDKPGAVEGSVNKGPSSKDNFVLSQEERQVMQRFVRQGVMSEQEYIAELKKVRG